MAKWSCASGQTQAQQSEPQYPISWTLILGALSCQVNNPTTLQEKQHSTALWGEEDPAEPRLQAASAKVHV